MSKPAKPTTPEEERIELRPDAWERFERTVKKVAQARPIHRTAKTIGEGRVQKPAGGAKSSD